MKCRSVYVVLPPDPERDRPPFAGWFDVVGRTIRSPARIARDLDEQVVRVELDGEQTDGCVVLATSARVPVVFVPKGIGSEVAIRGKCDKPEVMEIVHHLVRGRLLQYR